MAVDKTLYTESSIESLNPLEFTRLRPQVYCGNIEYATQLLVEVFSNAVDEYRLGHGSQIDVDIKGSLVRVRDYGQGFLVNSLRDDGKTILEAAFSVLNTSGKYREDGTYEGTSLGSFGIGAKLACFLSHWMDVMTYRDGQMEYIKFHEGVFESRKVGKINVPTGTCVEWEASEEFFDHPEVNISEVKSLFKTIASLCPGLTINLDDNGVKSTYVSKNGINDLVNDAVKDKELIDNRFEMNFESGKNKIDMVMTYTSNYSLIVVPYVNTGLTIAGPHITQIKALLTREFNKFFREKKWLKEKDENLTGDDIQEGLYIVFNITAPSVGYDAQVKSRITKLDMTPFTAAIIENLHYWFAANEKEIKVIADKALNARRAREAAQKAREAARGNKEKKKKKVINPDKLKDAERLGQNAILLCVEGNSAAASMAVARDTENYGILGLRGKPLNLLTNSKEKADKNEEIQLLISALGITPGAYNPSELRYGKVAIASDSDSDE